ncbi:hypothetical protein PHAVU_008G096100 [Phaseolus vulgaris]|uniref:Uncharacterized protein n=1 Tax=Phaseolus vulgaris TaxID=3885 RepID=V7B3W2_PHAVU|nr:hypothetical protein PHAVU_008G096100g [Phaseolus vulgaris]ESW12240.1 hypothetical protein PHAVU_008G096100g [Phaseolus vulgaris]
MTPEESDTYMFMKTTKDVWDICKANNSKVGDASQIYEIKMRISNTKQGNYSVKCNEDTDLLKRYEKDKMYKFLIGLNNKFEPVRIQVLGKDLSSLNERMIVYHAEEDRRGVMLEPHELKKVGQGQITSFGNEVGGINIPKGENEDSLWCTYCKKLRHTQDKCWKLHGKPPNPSWNWTLKGNKSGGHTKVHMA